MLLMVLPLFTLIGAWAQWIDPHDMNTNSRDKMHPNLEHKEISSCEFNSKLEDCFCDSDVYLRRIIGLLLNNAYLIKEKSSYSGNLHIDLSLNEYQILHQFSQSNNDKLNDDILKQISTILEIAVKKPYFEKFSDELFTFKEMFYSHFINAETGVLLIFVLVLYAVYKLRKADFTLWLILKHLLVLAYITDWMLTFLQLKSELEIETIIQMKELGALPPQCDVNNMTWTKYLKYLLVSKTECQMYYMAANRKINYFITPLKVFTHQFGILIVKPMEYMGNGIGLFYKSMFVSLPWGLNLLLFPVILIVLGVTLIIILVFLTRTPIKVNILHLFKIEFGESQAQFLTHQHRPFIETVKPKKLVQKNETITTNRKRELANEEISKNNSHQKSTEESNKISNTEEMEKVIEPCMESGKDKSETKVEK